MAPAQGKLLFGPRAQLWSHKVAIIQSRWWAVAK
jgi:hypothetical protein